MPAKKEIKEIKETKKASPKMGINALATPEAEANSFLDLQRCSTSSADVDYKLEFGVWKNGYTCPDIIQWFVEGIDFILTDRSGELTVSREDVDNSSTAYSQTTSGLVSHTRSMTMSVAYGSRLYQKFMDIQIRDSQEGYEGRLLQKYSDGGFHMQTTIKANDESFALIERALNIKLETFIDTFFQDFSSTENDVELSMMIEFAPYYEISGTLPSIFALPTGMTAPTFSDVGTVTNTATEMQITGISYEDVEMLAYDDEFVVQVIDETGSVLGFTSGTSTTTDVTITGSFTTGQEVTVQYGYKVGEQTVYFIASQLITLT